MDNRVPQEPECVGEFIAAEIAMDASGEVLTKPMASKAVIGVDRLGKDWIHRGQPFDEIWIRKEGTE